MDSSFDDILPCAQQSPAKSSPAPARAKWAYNKNPEILAAICVRVDRATYSRNNSFTATGWRHVTEQFNRRTGNNYTVKQIKNQIQILKKQWLLYKNYIIGQTGIRWSDDGRRRICMDGRWWRDAIAAKKELQNFMGKDLYVFHEYGKELFDSFLTTRYRPKIPIQYSSQGSYEPVHGGEGEDMQHFNPESDSNPQHSVSGEGEDQVIAESLKLMFMEVIEPLLLQAGLSIDSSGNGGSKRKRVDSQCREMEKMNYGMAFEAGIDKLIQYTKEIESNKPVVPSITRCMKVLNAMLEKDMFDVTTYVVILNLFVQNEGNREVFMALKDDTTRLMWIKGHKAAKDNPKG